MRTIFLVCAQSGIGVRSKTTTARRCMDRTPAKTRLQRATSVSWGRLRKGKNFPSLRWWLAEGESHFGGPVMRRRGFLKQSSAALAFGLGACALGEEKKPLFLISLAQWSLHRAFFGKKLDPIDFAKIAKNDYGIAAVEYVNQFYKDKKKDDAYVAELKKRADGEGVRSVLIMCDGEGALGDKDEKKRK